MMYFTFLSSLKLFSHKSHVEYSAHWIQRLASVTGVEVAIDSAVAIYVMQELQVPLGLRSL